jgi:hypothetical protein
MRSLVPATGLGWLVLAPSACNWVWSGRLLTPCPLSNPTAPTAPYHSHSANSCQFSLLVCSPACLLLLFLRNCFCSIVRSRPPSLAAVLNFRHLPLRPKKVPVSLLNTALDPRPPLHHTAFFAPCPPVRPLAFVRTIVLLLREELDESASRNRGQRFDWDPPPTNNRTSLSAISILRTRRVPHRDLSRPPNHGSQMLHAR